MSGYDTRELVSEVGDEWPDLDDLDVDDESDDGPPPLEAA